jgi:hypothetical protein
MKELIGKKIKGFKFDKIDILPYNKNAMDNYIGKVGVITKVHDKDVKVEFENDYWFYPLPEALNHIVEEHPKRGNEVLVWDDNQRNAVKRIFLAYIKGTKYPVITVINGDEELYKNGDMFGIYFYKHYKLPTQKTKLTLQQIADKFEIDVNDLEVER